MSFIIAHSLYLIPHLDEIYRSTTRWRNPFPISSELSLTEPFVYVSSIVFVIILIIFLLRSKTCFVNDRLFAVFKNTRVQIQRDDSTETQEQNSRRNCIHWTKESGSTFIIVGDIQKCFLCGYKKWVLM